MNKTIRALGLVGALAFAGSACSRQPVEMKNVRLGGNSYAGRPDVICAFYDSDGNRTPVVNKDKNFNQAIEYDAKGPHLQGTYNVLGYTELGQTYATNITPVKVSSN